MHFGKLTSVAILAVLVCGLASGGVIWGVRQGGTGTAGPFTAGSVVYAGGGGLYKQTNAQFFWDATNYRLGIGTATPSTDLGFGGEAARVVGMERRTASAGTGLGLTVSTGGAKSGSTDKAGGDLTLASGTSTGSGSSSIIFQTPAAGSTGTTDHAVATRFTLTSAGLVSSNARISTGQTTITSTAGAATFDCSTGNSFFIDLTENTTLTLSNIAAGQTITALIHQHASAAKTFAWPATVKAGMTISVTTDKYNAQTFICNATTCYATSAGSTGM